MKHECICARFNTFVETTFFETKISIIGRSVGGSNDDGEGFELKYANLLKRDVPWSWLKSAEAIPTYLPKSAKINIFAILF